MASYYGTTTIVKEAKNIDIADALEPYSGVRLSVGVDDDGNELVYIAGSMDGRVLDVENPFGTQTMANRIFNSVRGFRYQPMYADGALLNPVSDIGDGVSVNDVYSHIYTRATTFGTLMLSDISAPTSEEVIHEYNIPTPTERKFQRLNYDMKSEFKITNQAISAEVSARRSADSSLSGRIDVNATAITAKVSKNSPSGQTSFGWALSDSEWRVFNQSGNILRATSAGLEVKGKIQADEGYIGGANGFVIKASAIYNGISSFGDNSKSGGVYIGTDGIQLGRGFRVDSSGNLHVGESDAPRTVTETDYPITFYGGTYVRGSQYPIYFEAKSSNNISGVYLLTPSQYESFIDDPFDFDYNAVRVSSSNYRVTSSGQDLKCTFTTAYLDSLAVGRLYVIALIDNSYSRGFPFEKADYFANFDVSSSGAVTATNLTINGGSINIGNKFRVTRNGDLYATTGTFEGHVYAKNITAGGDAGTFDGYGLTPYTVEGGTDGAMGLGTVDTGNVIDSINASLANGDYAANEIDGGFSGGLNVSGTLVYRSRTVSWKQVRLADGGIAFAMCQQ